MTKPSKIAMTRLSLIARSVLLAAVVNKSPTGILTYIHFGRTSNIPGSAFVSQCVNVKDIDSHIIETFPKSLFAGPDTKHYSTFNPLSDIKEYSITPSPNNGYYVKLSFGHGKMYSQNSIFFEDIDFGFSIHLTHELISEICQHIGIESLEADFPKDYVPKENIMGDLMNAIHQTGEVKKPYRLIIVPQDDGTSEIVVKYFTEEEIAQHKKVVDQKIKWRNLRVEDIEPVKNYVRDIKPKINNEVPTSTTKTRSAEVRYYEGLIKSGAAKFSVREMIISHVACLYGIDAKQSLIDELNEFRGKL